MHLGDEPSIPVKRRRRTLSHAEEEKGQKHRKEIKNCPHAEKTYYANGMCKNCYHAKGRKKLATTCGHGDRVLYAKGMCKNCYLSKYHKNKRIDNKNAKKREETVQKKEKRDLVSLLKPALL